MLHADVDIPGLRARTTLAPRSPSTVPCSRARANQSCWSEWLRESVASASAFRASRGLSPLSGRPDQTRARQNRQQWRKPRLSSLQATQEDVADAFSISIDRTGDVVTRTPPTDNS